MIFRKVGIWERSGRGKEPPKYSFLIGIKTNGQEIHIFCRYYLLVKGIYFQTGFNFRLVGVMSYE